MRLRTLPLAIAGITMSGFLSALTRQFNVSVFLLCLCTAILLQILSNLANDLGDTLNGADLVERKGPKRTVQSSQISRGEMKIAIKVFIFLSLLSGLFLVILSVHSIVERLLFVGFGLSSILAAVFYTMSKNPYGYKGYGDLFVFLFFGLVAVLGTYYLQTHELKWIYVLPAFSLGLLSTGVLNINNMRDVVSDQKANKLSIPVRYGLYVARIYHSILILASLIFLILFGIQIGLKGFQWGFVLSFSWFILHLRKVFALNFEKYDPLLRQLSLAVLKLVLFFGFFTLIFA